MSPMGHKRKSGVAPRMSAPGGRADIIRQKADIHLGPGIVGSPATTVPTTATRSRRRADGGEIRSEGEVDRALSGACSESACGTSHDKPPGHCRDRTGSLDYPFRQSALIPTRPLRNANSGQLQHQVPHHAGLFLPSALNRYRARQLRCCSWNCSRFVSVVGVIVPRRQCTVFLFTSTINPPCGRILRRRLPIRRPVVAETRPRGLRGRPPVATGRAR